MTNLLSVVASKDGPGLIVPNALKCLDAKTENVAIIPTPANVLPAGKDIYATNPCASKYTLWEHFHASKCFEKPKNAFSKVLHHKYGRVGLETNKII